MLIIAVTLLTPLKKLYGDYEIKTQDTTITPGFHDNYVVAIPVETLKEPSKVKYSGYDVCSCVSYARYLSGIAVSIPRRPGYSVGLAIDHPINSDHPKVGGIAILYDSWAGHEVYVSKVGVDNFTIKEANYYHCALSTRIIAIGSPEIKGFYNP